jgi:hypothetical protein
MTEIHVISVTMSRHEGMNYTTTMTAHKRKGEKDWAVGNALEAARKLKPGFSIDEYVVTTVTEEDLKDSAESA